MINSTLVENISFVEVNEKEKRRVIMIQLYGVERSPI